MSLNEVKTMCHYLQCFVAFNTVFHLAQALCKAVRYDDVIETMQLLVSGADVLTSTTVSGQTETPLSIAITAKQILEMVPVYKSQLFINFSRIYRKCLSFPFRNSYTRTVRRAQETCPTHPQNSLHQSCSRRVRSAIEVSSTKLDLTKTLVSTA